MYKIPLGPVQLFVKTYIRLGWVVSGHVNVHRAKEALEAVVERWRVLGARIQGDGKATPFHLAIPPQFGPSSPPFHFTHSTSSEPLSTVYPFPPSSHFASRIFTKPPPSVFSPSAPLSLAFPPNPSAPVLGIHIGHYPGVTAVGLRTSHTVFDGIAIGLVLREWEAALRDVDAYRAKGEDKTTVGQLGISPWLAKDIKIEPGWMPVGWGILSLREFGLAYMKVIGEYIERKILGSIEDRRMTIPKSFFENMKMDVRRYLLRTYPNGPHFNTSTADVVQAWLWKNILSNQSDSSTLTSFLSIASARDLLDYARVPCLNAFAIIITPPLSIREARALPLAELTLHSRRALEEQRTPEMLTKTFTWHENKPRGAISLQEGRQVMGLVSNLCKIGLNKVDLSPAVAKGTGDGQVLHSFMADDNGMASLNNGFNVDETPDGLGLNITGRAHKAVWESMKMSVEHPERNL